MTDADRAALAAELQRTNIKPHVLAREVSVRTGQELSTRKLRTLLTGTNSQLSADQWKAVLHILICAPDNTKLTRFPSERIPVTEEMRIEFKGGLSRSGLTLARLAALLRPQFSDVTVNKLSQISSGRLGTIDQEFWAATLKLLKAFASNGLHQPHVE